MILPLIGGVVGYQRSGTTGAIVGIVAGQVVAVVLEAAVVNSYDNRYNAIVEAAASKKPSR